jgi:hypothetical protein
MDKSHAKGALGRAAAAMFAVPACANEAQIQERLRPAGIRLVQFVPLVDHLDDALQAACREAASNGYCLVDECGALVGEFRLAPSA